MVEPPTEAATSPAALLFEACRELADTDAAMKALATRRDEIAHFIVSQVGFERDEGQESYEVTDPCGNGSAKLTIKQPVNTTIDQEAMPVVLKGVSGSIRRRIFTTKYALKTKEARAFAEADPATWSRIAQAITRKPGKVSVKLVELVR